jgi:ABC-2 type transport system ATP-binding protein
MVTETVLDVKVLLKDYDEYRAVDHISFTIKRGQVMGLLGPNGAGKSTTIQMLAGVTIPTSGSIHYFGKDLAKNRQACLQRINYASAYNTLQNHITAKENLLVFAALYGVKKPKEKIAEPLDYFGISRHINERYGHLSAGERTRVNLVKALLNDPELILMDEPTARLTRISPTKP